jgi:hypothetical protein
MVYEEFVAIAWYLLERRQNTLITKYIMKTLLAVNVLNPKHKTNIFYTPLVKPVDSEHPLPHTQLHHEHLVPEWQVFLLSSWQQLHELPITEPTGWVYNQQDYNPCEPGSYKWQKRKLNHVSFTGVLLNVGLSTIQWTALLVNTG